MTLLIHLAYIMYRSYRALGDEKNKRSLLCKYFSIIIVASIISNAIVITVDATTNRNAFDAADRRYLYIFDEFDQKERTLSAISQIATLLIWLFMQVILVTIIFVLYILTTKQCCATSSTSRDMRICDFDSYCWFESHHFYCSSTFTYFNTYCDFSWIGYHCNWANYPVCIICIM